MSTKRADYFNDKDAKSLYRMRERMKEGRVRFLEVISE